MDGIVEVRRRSSSGRGTTRRLVVLGNSLCGAAGRAPPLAAAARAAEPWTGIKECDHFGPIAPQTPPIPGMSIGGAPEEQSEDCLTLNIWSSGLGGEPRPVMVWIHGGGFNSGYRAQGTCTAAGHWPARATWSSSPSTTGWVRWAFWLILPCNRPRRPGRAVRSGWARATGALPTRSPRWSGCATTSPPSGATQATSPSSENRPGV